MKTYQDKARTLLQAEGRIAERPQNDLSQIRTEKLVLQMFDAGVIRCNPM